MTEGDSIMIEVKGVRRRASVIKVWLRSENYQMIMSTSSGPKGNTVNAVVTVFDCRPDVEIVALVNCAGHPAAKGRVSIGPVGLICGSRAGWSDVRGNRVSIEKDSQGPEATAK